MTIVVRPVDLDSEQQELVSVLQRNLPNLPHARRFEWLYRQNPHGPAWSWFACDQQADKVVGIASVFPRAMWVGGEVVLCGQVGDFAIDSSYRSLGPAVLLQRATFEPVNCGNLAFCYDCPPHEAGMSTFRRLGIQANCQMYRYARLLRADRKVQKFLGRGPWIGPVGTVANLLLRLQTRRRQSVPGLEITLHSGRFGEEFSLLDEQLARKEVIRARRQAPDLNWRYREDPLHEYQILTARHGRELVAFVVVWVAGQDASVVDFFGLRFPGVAVALLEAAVQHCRRASVQTVEAFLSDDHEFSAALKEAHFRCRSAAARVVAYARPGSEMSVLLEKRSRWSLNQVEILA